MKRIRANSSARDETRVRFARHRRRLRFQIGRKVGRPRTAVPFRRGFGRRLFFSAVDVFLARTKHRSRKGSAHCSAQVEPALVDIQSCTDGRVSSRVVSCVVRTNLLGLSNQRSSTRPAGEATDAIFQSESARTSKENVIWTKKINFFQGVVCLFDCARRRREKRASRRLAKRQVRRVARKAATFFAASEINRPTETISTEVDRFCPVPSSGVALSSQEVPNTRRAPLLGFACTAFVFHLHVSLL